MFVALSVRFPFGIFLDLAIQWFIVELNLIISSLGLRTLIPEFIITRWLFARCASTFTSELVAVYLLIFNFPSAN